MCVQGMLAPRSPCPTLSSQLLASCARIFIAVSVRLRPTLFQDPNVLRPDDPRVRGVPFTTRRPTLNEAKRAWERLSTVVVREVWGGQAAVLTHACLLASKEGRACTRRKRE